MEQKSSESSCGFGGGVDQLDARFADFCKNELLMDGDALVQATKLFSDCKHLFPANVSVIGTGMLEDTEQYWFALVLYSIKKLDGRDRDNSNDNAGGLRFNLCQVLRAAKLNVPDFLKELPHFVLKVGPILSNLYGTDWEKRLEAKELQTNFVHLIHLSEYYKRAFQEFFLTSDANGVNNPTGASSTGHVPDYHRFGWLLFLSLRVHVFSRFTDLVTCTNGVLSVLAILIIHVPVRFRRFNFSDTTHFVMKGNKVDLLASLCKLYETSEVDLRRTMDKVNNLITEKLKRNSCLATECQIENLENFVTDGLIYFEDLMEESSMSSNTSILDKDYYSLMCNSGELDERIFVDEEDSLLASQSLSGGVIGMAGMKRKIDDFASPTKAVMGPLSPYRSPAASDMNTIPDSASNSNMVATPVSTTMLTAKWLRTFISPLPSKPSMELEKFLSSCDRDVTADVIRRAKVILETIFPCIEPAEHYLAGGLPRTILMDNTWAEQRRSDALKLYYRVLEAMCIAESELLHAKNLTSLLTNERFHRCMLACSAELVIATHKTITMLFPFVLERTGITPFDLSKVIEGFIRHEDSLPRELKRHLNSLEERLLEKMVWDKGSSMYNSLSIARPALSAEIIRLGLLAEPMPSLDAIAMHNNTSVGSFPPASSLQKHENCLEKSCDIKSPKRLCTEYRSVLVERNSFVSPAKLSALSNLKLKLLQSAFASPTRPNPSGGGETCAETAINIFFGKILKLAAVRINGLVERLQLPQHMRDNVYYLFQKILNYQTTLFFLRHIDQIILCCFYGVAKILQISLTFREIIFNYRKQPHGSTQVFRSVYVDWTSAHRSRVKPLIVELISTEAAQMNQNTAGATNNNDGQCLPVSPKTSPFPNLPDMSPKKVSRNVYVSPLRSSKMDVLISQGSKSYYACVGESTHAYQSPSKDLNAINNRLNGSARKRALNFDGVDVGLVSDSLVASSLYLQNGSSGSTSGLHAKSEKPDA